VAPLHGVRCGPVAVHYGQFHRRQIRQINALILNVIDFRQRQIGTLVAPDKQWVYTSSQHLFIGSADPDIPGTLDYVRGSKNRPATHDTS
jgi:hypothetical protein